MEYASALKIGDNIKSFKIIAIKDGIGKKFSSRGVRTYKTKYLLLLSPRGEERVLEVGKKNLSQCERYMSSFSSVLKYKKHSMV